MKQYLMLKYCITMQNILSDQAIYYQRIFLLYLWIDFRLWFVTSSFIGSFTLLIFVSFQHSKDF